jgi:putative ABC transport system permease protein
MNIKDNVKMAYGDIMAYRSRSILTVLGIAIGITAIILVMAIGNSAKRSITEQIQSLGPTNVYIIPGKLSEMMQHGGSGQDSLKIKDLEDLKKKSNVPNIESVIPLVTSIGNATFESEDYRVTILGSVPESFDLIKLGIVEGEAFAQEDVDSMSSVAVIGPKVKNKLFGQDDVIGKKIKLKDKYFKVIGVTEAKGQGMGGVDYDSCAIVPYTTLQHKITGTKYFQEIIVKIDSESNIKSAISDMEEVLRSNHNINDPSKDDFSIQTQEDVLKSVNTILSVLTILLSSVAAISLIVGGVGVMNMMLTSVTERTREIGLRKALGATNKHILYQFLTEAVLLTSGGGLFGIFFGFIISYGLIAIFNASGTFNFIFSFPFSGAFTGILVASIVGFTFGIYPAYQASKKSPMDALRYE